MWERKGLAEAVKSPRKREWVTCRVRTSEGTDGKRRDKPVHFQTRSDFWFCCLFAYFLSVIFEMAEGPCVRKYSLTTTDISIIFPEFPIGNSLTSLHPFSGQDAPILTLTMVPSPGDLSLSTCCVRGTRVDPGGPKVKTREPKALTY